MNSEAGVCLDAVLIGGRKERAIVIVDYDTGWPQRFDALTQTIRDAVSEKAVAVEHIGSTAVPGLGAKAMYRRGRRKPTNSARVCA
ncbi:GrpB family protein [Arthrobacter sp. CG_A4]|uniref:GrpB family protein n=1 Tax=Arthrobacter sp. CG_A4 TaxID=3071706 RepID=UPI002E06EB15|nr:GrpB-like predicted nucleotidyltransferase (UPF0157 family) [Arthrobacter sp. CG_A4]